MTDLKNLKKIKSIDIDEFNGIKSKIGTVKLEDVETKDFGKGSQEVRQVLIESEVLNDDKERPITAREYVSLRKIDGEWGFSDSPKAKAQKMLNFFKVSSFDELQGKSIVVNKKQRDNGKEFLGFGFGN